MRDMSNSIKVSRALSPGAAVTDNTAQVSQILDMQGYKGAMLAIATGSLADTDATFTVLIEHSDNSGMSGAEAVPDAELTGTEAGAGFTFAADDSVRAIGYVGNKRYVRATITPANNTGNVFLSAVWLRGFPMVAPVSSPQS